MAGLTARASCDTERDEIAQAREISDMPTEFAIPQSFEVFRPEWTRFAARRDEREGMQLLA
jgi:hypothetical protein